MQLPLIRVNHVLLAMTSLLLTGCGSVLPPPTHEPTSLLATQQAMQMRYQALEQAVSQTTSDALAEAQRSSTYAGDAKKHALDALDMAQNVTTAVQDLSASLETLTKTVETQSVQQEPMATANNTPQYPAKGATLIVLLQAPDAALTIGASGPEVQQLNLLLILAGYSKESVVTSKFTAKTATAIKALQGDAQPPLDKTGKFDEATAHALAAKLGATVAPLVIAPGAPTPSRPNPLVRSGSVATQTAASRGTMPVLTPPGHK